MNAITNALREIKFNIPPQVLEIAFLEYYDTGKTPMSIDERIRAKVIIPRVYTDCNLVSGIHSKVDVSKCAIERLYNGEWMFTVPKELTGGKSILTPLEMVCNVTYFGGYLGYNVSSGLDIASKMYNNMATHNLVQTTNLELIGDNVILVHDLDTSIYTNAILRCVLEYDTNMSSLNPRAYKVFAKLCILATKAYIYNVGHIQMDKGYVYGGHELSSVKDVIDSYSDANEQYEEYMEEKGRKLLFMADTERYDRFVKAKFGNVI